MSVPDHPVWMSAAYPDHGSDRWAVRERGFTRFLDGPSAVRGALRRWIPGQPIVVGEPGASRFTVPTGVEQGGISRAARRSALRYTMMLSVAFYLLGMPVLAMAVWVATFGSWPVCVFCSEPYWTALGFAIWGLVLAWDARLQSRHRDALHQRALFFYWLRADSRAQIGTSVCVGLLMLMAALQWWMMQPDGGLKAAFVSYGLLYGRVVEGEVWRLLTGPYLHYSIVHFTINAFLFGVLGGLAWAFRGSLSLLVFVAACSVSLTAQMLFGGDVHDNAAGISGGVYALAGLVLGGTLTPAGRLPPGLATQLLVIVLLCTLFAELGSETAATVAHVTGLGFGLLVGAALSVAQR